MFPATVTRDGADVYTNSACVWSEIKSVRNKGAETQPVRTGATAVVASHKASFSLLLSAPRKVTTAMTGI